MTSTFVKFLFLVSAAVLLSGCTIVPAGQAPVARSDGGIWRSGDGGQTFAPINDVLATKGKVLSISNADINGLAFDPQDSATMYAASAVNGILYTTDGGASWQQFKDLKQGNFSRIAVDSKNKCVIFATAANKLYKTENCGRDWTNVYFHQKSQVTLTALAINPKAGATLYLGTSEGEILKSVDGGQMWLTANRTDRDKVMDIIIDPYDPRIVYAGTGKKGLLKSSDSGANWHSLGAGLASYIGSQQYGKLIYDPATANSLIFVSKFGMLKTIDGGDTWKIIDLLPAHKTTNILAVAVNPKNSDEFYYVTASTLVKTIDGGVKWSSRQLPYSRLTTDIKISPATSSAVYLSTRAVKN